MSSKPLTLSTITTGALIPATFCLVPTTIISSRFSGMSICHPIHDEKAMKLALPRAIYSAVLNTEATATFMLLPASVRHMITNATQNSSMLTHIFAISLGPFQKASLPMANPNPGPARKLPSPSIPGGLANAIPEAKWIIKNVRNDPIQKTKKNSDARDKGM
eukprot:1137162-Pelagomonas_calceolata.AAC.2